MKHGKKYSDSLKLIDHLKQYDPEEIRGRDPVMLTQGRRKRKPKHLHQEKN